MSEKAFRKRDRTMFLYPHDDYNFAKRMDSTIIILDREICDGDPDISNNIVNTWMVL